MSKEKKENDGDVESIDSAEDKSADSQDPKEDKEEKVIVRGDAKLIISKDEDDAAEDATKSSEIEVKPRVISVVEEDKDELQEADEEDSQLREVIRLENEFDPVKERIKIDKAKFEKLENSGTQSDKEEENWGREIAVGWWFVICGLGITVIILGSLSLKYYFDNESKEDNYKKATLVPLEDENPHQGSPEQWFHERSVQLEKKALLLLGSYLKAENQTQQSLGVREPDLFLKHHADWPYAFRPRAEENEATWQIDHIDETAYLTFTGKDQDFLPLKAYFVRDGDQLKLDWHASVAWSEVPMKVIKDQLKARQDVISKIQLNYRLAVEKAKLANTQQSTGSEDASANSVPEPTLPDAIYTNPVLIRCLLTRRDEFYAGPYNDTEHSAFMLRSPDRLTYLWGYVQRDSPLDQSLRRHLDHGRFVVDLKKDLPMTIRVKSGKKDALPFQVELVELVHPGWVTP